MASASRRRFVFATVTGSLWLAGCSTAPPARRSTAAAQGIDETAFVPLGGIEQWISIHGHRRDNPVILVVHGGPGESQWPLADHYAAWETDFTVVQWDQRGTGHTFGRYGEQTPDVNLERIARDGIELSAYLRKKLGKRKIIVLGHSWGSIVAARMVVLEPQTFAAYVGTGQVASWKASVTMQFDLLLAKARRDGDAATVAQLEAIGRPNPADAQQYFAFTRTLGAAMAPADQVWLQSLRAKLPALKTTQAKDVQDLIGGMEFSAKQVLPDQMAADLPATARRIDTAFFVIQGRDDVVTPTQAAIDYAEQVQSPHKELILIADAGHFAFMTHSGEFLAALTGKVRPVAIARGA